MVKRSLFIGIMVIASLGVAIHSQALTVDYLDSNAQVLKGNSWMPLILGTTLESNTTVRVPQNGMVIIGFSGGSIQLSEGTHALASIVEAARKNTPGLGASLNHKLQLLGSGSRTTNAVSGGVRADGAKVEDTTVYDSDDPWVLMENLPTIFQKNDSIGAATNIKAIMSLGLPSEQGVLGIAIMTSALQAGKPLMAMEVLSLDETTLDPMDVPQWILAKAQILLEGKLYNRLNSWLTDSVIGKVPTISQQRLTYIKALSYQAMGQDAAYRTALTKAIALDRQSPLALELAKL